LTCAERQQLVNLMLNFINDRIVDDHIQIVHSGAQLFEGHRSCLGKMETWLTQNGGGQFATILKWDPATQIPKEFNVMKPKDNGEQYPPLQNLNPNKPLIQAFQKPTLCSFSNAANLGNAINGWHLDIHMTVGGAMGNAMISPAASIFWCLHGFLDDVYSDFLSCQTPGFNRNLELINFDILSDTTNMPSAKVSEKLFKEWSNCSKINKAFLK
jgi:hypothetical protein